MIEPTETESKETLDQFCDAMIQIAREAETNPHLIHEAPVTTPVRRLDQTLAARQPRAEVDARRNDPGVSDSRSACWSPSPLDGAANMALDEALLLGRLAGTAPPTLRFFAWAARHHLARLRPARSTSASTSTAARRPRHRPRAPAHRRQRHPPRGAGARGDLQRGGRARATSRAPTTCSRRIGGSARALARRAPAAWARRSRWCRCSLRIRPRCRPSASRGPARTSWRSAGLKVVGSAQRRQGAGFLQHGAVMLGAAPRPSAPRVPDRARSARRHDHARGGAGPAARRSTRP